MTSTARLLRADSSKKIHAQEPNADSTLCGLTVVAAEAYESGEAPVRSAAYTGLRFYEGMVRIMCKRCVDEAPPARKRVFAEGAVVELSEVRSA